jgi:hypothetical protein
LLKQGKTKSKEHSEQSGYWRGGIVSSVNFSTTFWDVMEGEAWVARAWVEEMGEVTAWVVFVAVVITAWNWGVLDTDWGKAASEVLGMTWGEVVVYMLRIWDIE